MVGAAGLLLLGLRRIGTYLGIAVSAASIAGCHSPQQTSPVASEPVMTQRTSSPPPPVTTEPTDAADLEGAATLRYAAPQEKVKSCPTPTWPAAVEHAPPPGNGQRVLILGDSLTKYSLPLLTKRLRAQGWLPTVVCWGGTQTPWAIAEARNVARQRYIPERVVMAMGTNDVHKNACFSAQACQEVVRVFGRNVERMLTYLGPQRMVYWVNIDMDAPRAAKALGEPWNLNYPTFNQELAKVLDRYPNATLIDFHNLIQGARGVSPIPYEWDGLHYAPVDDPSKSKGTQLRINAIAEALRGSATS